jgi:two-component system sensor histidine kinase YesM
MFIPVLILGVLMIGIINMYVTKLIDQQNEDRVRTYSASIVSVLSDLELMNLNISSNKTIQFKLRKILQNTTDEISSYDYELYSAIVDLLYSSVSAEQEIASMYVYLENDKGWFVSSNSRFIDLNHAADTSWFDSYNQKKEEYSTKFWTEIRYIQTSPGTAPFKVLTIYRKILAADRAQSAGVIVLNVYVDLIDISLGELTDSIPGSILLVNDADNALLFTSVGTSEERDALLQYDSCDSDDRTVYLNKESYRRYFVELDAYNWTYTLLIPERQAYRIVHILRLGTLILMQFSLMINILIALYLARKNQGEIHGLQSVLQQAREGQDIPEIKPSAKSDLYHYMIQDVIRTFLRIDYLQTQLSQKKYLAKILELQTLQSQLTPHFLYNTMQTIYWKAIALTGTPNDTSAMIGHVSDLLHYVLDDVQSFSTLDDEIVMTENYLAIQTIRYQNMFTVLWKVSCLDRTMRVPKLILQPLLENAIMHGLKAKGADGYLSIHMYNHLGKYLKIRIVDNGVGMPVDISRAIRKRLAQEEHAPSDHIGLSNAHRRLRLLYGEPYGLHLVSKEQKGTCISFSIPLFFTAFDDSAAVQ